MDLAGFTIALVACLVAALTLWVNFNQYRLARSQGTGAPGLKLDPDEAAKTLDQIGADPVRTVASQHIYIESEKRKVGYINRQEICVYLDLHSASCDPVKRETLSKALAEFVQATLVTDLSLLSVTSPREGNLLVGSSVAGKLGANFLMIRTGRAPRFGYPIEGSFTPGTTAIIVDDLCMEGTFLKRCVQHLRRYGINVSHCFCLFERLDGDAREVLESLSVDLHSKYQIEDETLKELKAQTEAQSTRRSSLEGSND
jgi:orotate phosphoribosyltransferase